MRIKITAILLALSLTLPLASCKKEGNTGDDNKDGNVVVVEDDSKISLALYDAEVLNPLETTSPNVQNIMNIIYEPLFTLDERKKSVPILADGYSMSEDGRQILITLDKSKKWHNGTSFTSDDVVYTLSKLMSAKGLYQKTAKKIAAFTAIDKYTVQIDLTSPQVDFSHCLTFPIISAQTEYKKTDFVPMGTGTYKYVSGNNNEIILEAVTDENGTPISKKSISVKILENPEAALRAFNTKEIDAITSYETNLCDTAPKSNSIIKQTITNNMVFLGFNCADQRLTPDLKRAIALVIDKKKLLETSEYGYGKVCDVSVNPESAIYQPADMGGSSQDYINTMLQHLGYTKKGDYFENENGRLSFRILVNKDNESRTVAANNISQMLNKFGIEANVVETSYNDYAEKIWSDQFDMFVGEISAEGIVNPLEMLEGSDNYFNFNADNLKNAVLGMYGACDTEKLIKGLKEFTKQFTADLPYLPLYYKAMNVYYGTYVTGITAPASFDAFKNIEKWVYYNNEAKESELNE